MNEIVDKFLLFGDKFMLEMHLKKPGFLIVPVDHLSETQSDKVLRDKAFKIASDPKYDDYQRGLASMVYKSFDKRSIGSGVDAEPNYHLANELQTQIIRKFRRKFKFWKFWKFTFRNLEIKLN